MSVLSPSDGIGNSFVPFNHQSSFDDAEAFRSTAVDLDQSLSLANNGNGDAFGLQLPSSLFEFDIANNRPHSPLMPPSTATTSLAPMAKEQPTIALATASSWTPGPLSFYPQFGGYSAPSFSARPVASMYPTGYQPVAASASTSVSFNGTSGPSLYEQQFMSGAAIAPPQSTGVYVPPQPPVYASLPYASIATPAASYTAPPPPPPPPLCVPLSGAGSIDSAQDSDDEPVSPGTTHGGKKPAAAAKGKKRKNRSTGSEKKPAVPADNETLESKRQQRLMRNRASAQLSRERKKNYLRQLEMQLKELDTRNRDLHEQIANLTQENSVLKQRIQSLSVPPPPPPPPPPPASTMVPLSPAVHGSPPALEPIPQNHSPPSSPLALIGNESAPSSPEFSGYSSFSHHQPVYATSGQHYQPTPHNAHKRVRLVAPSFQAQMARTGMLLFAFMFSFALFYNMAGLDLAASQDTFASAALPQPTSGYQAGYQTRRLHSIEEPELAALPSPSLVSVPSPQTSFAPSPSAGGSAVLAGADSAAASPLSTSSADRSQPASPNPLALLPHTQAAERAGIQIAPKQLAASDAVAKDLVVTADSSAPQHTYDRAMIPGRAAASHVPDGLYPGAESKRSGSDTDVFNHFRQLVTDSNMTLDANSSYIFCPQALHIKPTDTRNVSASMSRGRQREESKEQRHRSVSPGGRELRLPGPSPVSEDTAPMDGSEFDAEMRGSGEQQRIHFWVPTSSLLSSWDASFAKEPQPGLKYSGLAELSCVVSQLRPIMVRTTPSTPAAGFG